MKKWYSFLLMIVCGTLTSAALYGQPGICVPSDEEALVDGCDNTTCSLIEDSPIVDEAAFVESSEALRKIRVGLLIVLGLVVLAGEQLIGGAYVAIPWLSSQAFYWSSVALIALFDGIKMALPLIYAKLRILVSKIYKKLRAMLPVIIDYGNRGGSWTKVNVFTPAQQWVVHAGSSAVSAAASAGNSALAYVGIDALARRAKDEAREFLKWVVGA